MRELLSQQEKVRNWCLEREIEKENTSVIAKYLGKAQKLSHWRPLSMGPRLYSNEYWLKINIRCN